MGVGSHSGASRVCGSIVGAGDDSDSGGCAEDAVPSVCTAGTSDGSSGGASGGSSAGCFRGRPPALLEGPAPSTLLFLALGIVTFLPGRPMLFEQLRCTCRGSGRWGAACQ